jgi:hypothetical protein
MGNPPEDANLWNFMRLFCLLQVNVIFKGKGREKVEEKVSVPKYKRHQFLIL